MGFGNACVIMVGKSIGMGKIERGILDARRFTLLVPMIGVLLGCFILVFREQLIAIFNTSGTISATTMQATMAILLIYALEVPFRNIPYVQGGRSLPIRRRYFPGHDLRSGVPLDFGNSGHLFIRLCISLAVSYCLCRSVSHGGFAKVHFVSSVFSLQEMASACYRRRKSGLKAYLEQHR